MARMELTSITTVTVCRNTLILLIFIGVCGLLHRIILNLTTVFVHECEPSAKLIYLIYYAIVVVGYTANIIVLIAVWGHHKMRSKPFYALLSNLAAADFTYIVCSDRVGLYDEQWSPGSSIPNLLGLADWVCPVNRFISSTAFVASILTYMAIAIERYIAIVHPLRARTGAKKRNLLLILAIWLFASILELPTALSYRGYDVTKISSFLQATEDVRKTYGNLTLLIKVPQERWNLNPLSKVIAVRIFTCANLDAQRFTWSLFKWTEFLLTYALPVLLSPIIYGKICFVLREQDMLLRNNGISTDSRLKHTLDKHSGTKAELSFTVRTRRQAVRLMALCVIFFYVCYTPMAMLFIWRALFNPTGSTLFSYEEHLTTLSRTLLRFVTGFNQLIYSLFAHAFRKRVVEAVKDRRISDLVMCVFAVSGFYVNLFVTYGHVGLPSKNKLHTLVLYA